MRQLHSLLRLSTVVSQLWCGLLLLTLTAGFAIGQPFPQSGQSGTSSPAVLNGIPGGVGTNPSGGGGANADFTTLIDLIQTTIPGDWDTGEDTITQFPSGVWVDPQGVMRRPSTTATKPRFIANDQTADELSKLLGKSQASQELRWISLGEISRFIADPASHKLLSQPSAIIVGGLSRIDYLHFEPSDKQWYIGGPAGGFKLNSNGDLISEATGLPPILLEDLLTIAPQVLQGQKPFGCTIDPTADGLAGAGKLLQDPTAVQMLSRNPAKFAELLGNAVGPQNLTLINLPEGCQTGVALLAADEHMKRIGLELAVAPKNITSYWDAAEKRRQQPSNAMVRWWFALADSPIALLENEEGQSIDYKLDQSSVRVLSQAQWMNATGERFDLNARDEAADDFAASFSENFVELQQQYPVYGRLRHIFDIAVISEMIRRDAESGQAAMPKGLATWDNRQQKALRLSTIDTLVAWKKLNKKSVSAVASGGVLAETKGLKIRDSQKTSEEMSRLVLDGASIFNLQ